MTSTIKMNACTQTILQFILSQLLLDFPIDEEYAMNEDGLHTKNILASLTMAFMKIHHVFKSYHLSNVDALFNETLCPCVWNNFDGSNIEIEELDEEFVEGYVSRKDTLIGRLIAAMPVDMTTNYLTTFQWENVQWEELSTSFAQANQIVKALLSKVAFEPLSKQYYSKQSCAAFVLDTFVCPDCFHFCDALVPEINQ